MARSMAVSALLAATALQALASGGGAAESALRGAEPARAPELPRPAQGGFLRGQGGGRVTDVTTAEVEKSLVSELAGNVSVERLQELEAALRPMYAALPKGSTGYLGHQAVRYALHRLLLQRHGWFVVGLEPTDEVLPPYLHGEWVPEYLQGLLEERLGGRGVDLQETAALAAALEDLVRSESTRRMDLLYGLLRVPAAARLDSGEVDRVMETYMMMYLDGGNFTAPDKDLDIERAAFKAEYTDWDMAATWMHNIKEEHLRKSGDSKLDHSDMVSIANELGERFGAFNDGECRSLKRELVGMEGLRPGRVPLLDFYKRGLYSHWDFNERVDYLRAIGALDESDALRPAVVLPNYLAARTNCLAASSLYAVCCRNECEDLMGHLERELASATAAPQRILALVANLASDTTNASRVLPDLLVQRLHQIAARHGGKVPLHGRLFAQWMHHAYPHECPFPHEGGVNPLTPDEWMREAGEGESKYSQDEVRQLLGECAKSGAGGRCGGGASGEEAAEEAAELPWSDAEVLLTGKPGPAESSAAWAVVVKASLLLVLLPLAYASGRSKLAQGSGAEDPEDAAPLKPGQGGPRWQHVGMLLALVAGGGLLELLGVLDRFSFACTLAGGLLLNVVAPLLLRRAPAPDAKPSKCCV